MKKLLILILLAGCKKIEMRDPITDGAKLTKADAGRITNYSGTWWSEAVKDSLVIELRSITDSVRYRSNMPQADPGLTHSIDFVPKDEQLFVLGTYWRIQH